MKRNVLTLFAFLGASMGSATNELSTDDIFIMLNVIPGVHVPVDRPTLSNLSINYSTVEEENLLESLLGSTRERVPYMGFSRVIDQGSQRYRNPYEQEVEIYPHGGFAYRYPYHSSAVIRPVTRKEAEEIRDLFLGGIEGGLPPDATMIRSGEIKGGDVQSSRDALGLPLGYFFEYGRRHDGVQLHPDHIQITVVGPRVFEMYWSWGAEPSILGEPAQVIPAVTAAQEVVSFVYTQLLGEKPYATVKVTGIRLVYTWSALEEAWKRGEDRELVPAWDVNVVVEPGGRIHLPVDARTGEIIRIF
ncbi:hypothetical protein H8D30_06315 [bacterium]|nr:hypothetical protein [bacterium]